MRSFHYILVQFAVVVELLEGPMRLSLLQPACLIALHESVCAI